MARTITFALLFTISLAGCRSARDFSSNVESKNATFEYERTIPGVKIRTIFFPDTFNVVDTIRIIDTSGRGSSIIWKNKYNQLVVDCETQNDVERIVINDRQESQGTRQTIERTFEGIDITKLILIIIGVIILILLLKR